MKKTAYLALLFITALLIAACAGHVRGNIETSNSGVSYSGTNINILGPSPPGPEELARAYAIKKGADAMSQGKVMSSDLIIIGFVNNDQNEKAYIYHPEIPGFRVDIMPKGGFAFVQVRNIPKEIVFYDQQGNIVKQMRPNPANMARVKIVNGTKVDLLFTINKM